jgi:hypothetical protein
MEPHHCVRGSFPEVGDRVSATDTRQAWDFFQAVEATRKAKEAQEDAETAREEAAEALATAELTYRKALAQEITRQHGDGTAWTVCQDMARGEDHVAQLRYERDVAHGVLAATEQRAWRHTADRKDALALIEWSRVVAPLGEQRERIPA